MRLELTGRHISITPAIRAVVTTGLAHALRLLDEAAVSAQVVLTKEKTRVHAEVTLHARGEHFLHSEGAGRDVATAFAAAVAKVGRQAEKLKDKWAGRKRQGAPKGEGEPAAARGAGRGRAGRAQRAESEAAAPRVIRARRYAVKPMSIDDAAALLETEGTAFLVFRDASTEAVHVIFRRPDGQFGLINADA